MIRQGIVHHGDTEVTEKNKELFSKCHALHGIWRIKAIPLRDLRVSVVESKR
jgi:hypothetical protein